MSHVCCAHVSVLKIRVVVVCVLGLGVELSIVQQKSQTLLAPTYEGDPRRMHDQSYAPTQQHPRNGYSTIENATYRVRMLKEG